jgi:hypothetical protein
MRQEIEEALALWREAERRRDSATDGHRAELDAEIAQHRERFQHLTSRYMIERIDALKEAEGRRASAVPSTDPFHEAAREEKAIAEEIWDAARVSDEETPKS